MIERKGTFYFFTGLAGAGKTTIGGLFYRRQKMRRNDILLFDGDATRDVSGERDYSTQGRLASFRRGIGMEKLITSQGVDLVVCKIAMYHEVYDWYRKNIENYKLIYVRTSMETLLQRDQKKLYSSGVKQVVGVDLPFDEPEDADIIIDNNGQETPEEIVIRLERQLGMTGV